MWLEGIVSPVVLMCIVATIRNVQEDPVTLYIQDIIHITQDRRGFQDVVPIQMLAGCTSDISSALIG